MHLGKLFLLLNSLFLVSSVSGQTVWSSTSAGATGLQTVVNQFRNHLGTLNANVTGSFPSGRREINWDGVPDNFAAPNNLPSDFFNVNSPRGAVFFTPGTGFQVSANTNNPANAPVEFGNLNPAYPNLFATFSPQRLFTARGSTVTDVSFFLPGSNTLALVKGFGAVFTDVDLANVTKIQYFDKNNNSLGTFNVPNRPGNQTFSFLGVSFASPIIARVRITAGNFYPGAGRNESATNDIVVMDDFIYGEPFVDPALRRIIANAVAATDSAVNTTIQAKVEEKNGQEKEDANLQVSVRAFPNPSTRNFNISFESYSNGPVELQVRDMQGNVIERKANVRLNQTITLGDKYQPGIYLVEILQGSSRKQLRLIKR